MPEQAEFMKADISKCASIQWEKLGLKEVAAEQLSA